MSGNPTRWWRTARRTDADSQTRSPSSRVQAEVGRAPVAADAAPRSASFRARPFGLGTPRCALRAGLRPPLQSASRVAVRNSLLSKSAIDCRFAKPLDQPASIQSRSTDVAVHDGLGAHRSAAKVGDDGYDQFRAIVIWAGRHSYHASASGFESKGAGGRGALFGTGSLRRASRQPTVVEP